MPRTYYLAVTETPPDRDQPDGGVIFAGFFHKEDEVERAIQAPGHLLPEGKLVVYVGEGKDGKAPTSWTKRRKKVEIGPTGLPVS